MTELSRISHARGPLPVEYRLSHVRVAVERAVNRQATMIAAIFKWPVPIAVTIKKEKKQLPCLSAGRG